MSRASDEFFDACTDRETCHCARSDCLVCALLFGLRHQALLPPAPIPSAVIHRYFRWSLELSDYAPFSLHDIELGIALLQRYVHAAHRVPTTHLLDSELLLACMLLSAKFSRDRFQSDARVLAEVQRKRAAMSELRVRTSQWRVLLMVGQDLCKPTTTQIMEDVLEYGYEHGVRCDSFSEGMAQYVAALCIRGALAQRIPHTVLCMACLWFVGVTDYPITKFMALAAPVLTHPVYEIMHAVEAILTEHDELRGDRALQNLLLNKVCGTQKLALMMHSAMRYARQKVVSWARSGSILVHLD